MRARLFYSKGWEATLWAKTYEKVIYLLAYKDKMKKI